MVDTSPVFIITSPPVALPVPKPASIVIAPPVLSVPYADAPIIFPGSGVEACSPFPKTNFVFLITKFESKVIAPAGTSPSDAVTFASV